MTMVRGDRGRPGACAGLTAVLLLTGPVQAHHSTSMFDVDRQIRLQGVVRELRWSSPHVSLMIEVQTPEGETRVMTVEGAAPGALRLAGWSERSLGPGDRVLVVVNPRLDRDPSPVLGTSVLVEGGDYLPLGGVPLQRALAGPPPPPPD